MSAKAICPPMWSISGLRSVLNCNEEKAVELCERGALVWAFDLAAGESRRELRILPQCVADYQASRDCKLTWENVREILVPEFLKHARIASVEIQRVCNVTSTHVAHLIECGQLKRLVPGRRGPNGSAQIATQSFLEFLRRRAL